MTTQNLDYYRQRSEEELAAAERASDPVIAQIHYDMSRRYRELQCEDASVAEPVGGAFAGPGTVLA